MNTIGFLSYIELFFMRSRSLWE